jgi:hypothetical protein
LRERFGVQEQPAAILVATNCVANACDTNVAATTDLLTDPERRAP